MQPLTETRRHLEFVWYRALAEVRADSARNLFGFLWWIAEPVLYMGVFYVLFGLVLQQRGEHYVAFLLCGLAAWKWFDSAIKNASQSIGHSMPLIQQVYLPKWVFPAIAVTASTFRFGFVLAILLVFLFVSDVPVTAQWVIALPQLLGLQFLLTLGLAMILAAITPFVPDLKLVIDNGMMLLFFISGIFFRFDAIPDGLRIYFELNPLGMLIQAYRRVLVEGGTLEPLSMWPVLVLGAMSTLVGMLLLNKWDRIYVKRALP